MLFSYRLVWLGFRRPLVSKDLWCLKSSLWSKNIALKFDKHWKREKERVLRFVQYVVIFLTLSDPETNSMFCDSERNPRLKNHKTY